MPTWQVQNPIVILVYNRPDTTRRVFETVRVARPKHLLVVADGPRAGLQGETQQCAETRKIFDQVDWECQVSFNYSDENLGCKRRVSSGLDWAFQQVEQAIILEDDCLPDPSFFRYCDELLERYKTDERVMAISGSNLQFGHQTSSSSYRFSKYFYMWGWASWKRAWRYYDVNMRLWPRIRENRDLSPLFPDRKALAYWTLRFNQTYTGIIDTWDYQWMFACFLQRGLTVFPQVNLISNIGFNDSASHTLGKRSRLANIPTQELSFPLRHPDDILPDEQADEYLQKTVFVNHPFAPLKKKVKQLIQRRIH